MTLRAGRWRRVVRLLAVGALAILAIASLPACGDDGGTTETAEETTTTRAPDRGATIPDLPVAGAAGECLTSAATFAAMGLLALGGEDKALDAQAQVSKLKEELPTDLHDDIDIVASTFGNIAENGVVAGADELAEPAFVAATEAISNHLSANCK